MKLNYKSQKKQSRKLSVKFEIASRTAMALLCQHWKIFQTEKERQDALLIAEIFPQQTSYLVESLPKCESPIERAFVFELARHCIPAIPQYAIPPYRADFALADYRIVVELDGHDYHASREARQRDAQRDRFLSANGWRVIRFTGREVYQHPSRCAIDLSHIIKGLPLMDWRR